MVSIDRTDVLDVFPEPGGVLLIMEEKHLQTFRAEDTTEPVQVTYLSTPMLLEDIQIGRRGRIGIKLKIAG